MLELPRSNTKIYINVNMEMMKDKKMVLVKNKSLSFWYYNHKYCNPHDHEQSNASKTQADKSQPFIYFINLYNGHSKLFPLVLQCNSNSHSAIGIIHILLQPYLYDVWVMRQ